MPGSVALVSGVPLRQGAGPAHEVLHDAGVRAPREQGGLIRAELIPAVPGVQDDTVALLTFADRPALDVWLGSPERAAVLRQMDELSEADRSLNVLSGFPGWFTTPGSIAPPRWKQALLVIAGLILVSFAVTTVRELILPDVGEWGVILIHAVANVCVLTWLVMPPLNRMFARWLQANSGAPVLRSRKGLTR